MSACGVPPSLFDPTAASAAREGYRQYLFSTVQPVGRLVAHELELKLEDRVTFNWAELRAADVQARARAFASMVAGSKSVEDAAMLTGLLVQE